MTPQDTLLYWIKERQFIYARKLAGMPKPWTKDKILQSYRFCNVYREQDTVTRWIATHWRDPFSFDEDLWFAMVVARLINWPDTLEEIGYPVPWNPRQFCRTIHDRQERGDKAFGGAYIVSTNGHALDKADYLAKHVLAPLWASRTSLRPSAADTLAQYHAKLTRFNGLGSFMAAQVIADLKYTPPLDGATDWWSFAASGPGSRRGMNRILGRPISVPWREADWHKNLMALNEWIAPQVRDLGLQPLHAQDLQNCLCEFDKYMRTKNGEGRPRATYPGLAE